MLSTEELIKIGVNPDNLTYPGGEMNVIVQCFGFDDETIRSIKDTGENIVEVSPDIYHPRKNSVWSCGCKGDNIPIETYDEKEDWIKHLRDSAERLKIMSYYLMKQAEEIEKFGYPKTDLYYPE